MAAPVQRATRRELQQSFSFYKAYIALKGLGSLPLIILIFFPRLFISLCIVLLAQFARAIARLMGTAPTYEKKANLRILIITDYMPPQTHGIAIRFNQYVEHMRRQGHEVQVFSTNITKERETSFDHPNLPSIINPFNVLNKMAYNPGAAPPVHPRARARTRAPASSTLRANAPRAGVKLAWYLGAKQWDLVHLVFPSNLCLAILPVCNWRRIPVYCSHHVDMEYYVGQYVHLKLFADLGHWIYWILIKLPATRLANVNAAPTLCFLKSHMPHVAGMRARIPSGVIAARFRVDDASQIAAERRELLRTIGADPAGDACVLIMVQRLAPEKDTQHALEALQELSMRARAGGTNGGRPRLVGGMLSLDGVRPVYIAIAGDGPARKSLEAYASKHALPVTFLGNLRNDALPPLYRAADAFVTCSTSETFGLTVLEALACGTPAVMPRCAVFDELWGKRVPASWRYKHGSPSALLEAIVAAGAVEAKRRMAKEPIKAAWSDATDELLDQYNTAIEANLHYRQANTPRPPPCLVPPPDPDPARAGARDVHEGGEQPHARVPRVRRARVAPPLRAAPAPQVPASPDDSRIAARAHRPVLTPPPDAPANAHPCHNERFARSRLSTP